VHLRMLRENSNSNSIIGTAESSGALDRSSSTGTETDAPSTSKLDETTNTNPNVNAACFVTYDQQWQIMLDRLVQYKQTHGHCLVPNRYKSSNGNSNSNSYNTHNLLNLDNSNNHASETASTSASLGQWVSRQRRHYRLLREGKPSTMTQERIQQLERVGFVWNARDMDVTTAAAITTTIIGGGGPAPAIVREICDLRAQMQMNSNHHCDTSNVLNLASQITCSSAEIEQVVDSALQQAHLNLQQHLTTHNQAEMAVALEAGTTEVGTEADDHHHQHQEDNVNHVVLMEAEEDPTDEAAAANTCSTDIMEHHHHHPPVVVVDHVQQEDNAIMNDDDDEAVVDGDDDEEDDYKLPSEVVLDTCTEAMMASAVVNIHTTATPTAAAAAAVTATASEEEEEEEEEKAKSERWKMLLDAAVQV